MLKVSHEIIFYFLRYAHVSYVKGLLTNIQNNKICQKLAYILRNLQASQANKSSTLRIKNVKFSRYCLYMHANI